MQITIYKNFTKRRNSTKQASNGTNVDVVLKNQTSIESPVFILSGGVSSYDTVTAVKWGSRYYFVTDITSDKNGITEISCNLDRMATYKSYINAASCFIERSSSGWQTEIVDPMYTTTGEIFTEAYTATDNVLPKGNDEGYLSILAAGTKQLSTETGGGVQIYFAEPYPDSLAGGVADSAEFVVKALWDTTFINKITASLKDAYSALIKCTYIPGFTADWLKTTNNPNYTLTPAVKYASDVALCLGDHEDANIQILSPGSFYKRLAYYTKEFKFDPAWMGHFTSYYTWRNQRPYSQWSVYLPFYGVVPFDWELYDVAGSDIVFKVVVDLTCGDMEYVQIRITYPGGGPTDYIINTYRTNIGVQVPITQISGSPLQFASSVVSTAAGIGAAALSGGGTAAAIGLGAAATSAGEGIARGMERHVSANGGFSAGGCNIQVAEGRKIQIYQTGHESYATAAQYGVAVGGPVMTEATISSYAGYIKCRNAMVDMPGTKADKDYVENTMNEGFYLE